jgi:hypothetical protein
LLAAYAVNAPTFPPERYYNDNLLVDTHTSTTFATVLTLAPTVAGGTYELGYSYTAIGDNAAEDQIVVVRHAGGNQGNAADPEFLHYIRLEPTDSDGISRVGGTGTDQEWPHSGFVEVVLPPGLVTFTIEHRSSLAGSTVSLWDPRLKLVRVA